MPTTPTTRFTREELLPANRLAEDAEVQDFVPSASLYYQAGAFLQNDSANAGNLIPVPSGVNGTPVAINKRTFTTDANGKVAYGTPATAGGEQGQLYTTGLAFVTGLFPTASLVQTGAGAIAAAYGAQGNGRQCGRLLFGSTSAGLFRLP